MFVAMDRYHELENLRRSLAMLPPQSAGLDREQAMRLVAELQAMDRRVQHLRCSLASLLAQDGLEDDG